MWSWASACQVHRLEQHGCLNNGQEFGTAGRQGGKERVGYNQREQHQRFLCFKMPFAVAWMDLESVILSELSQTDKYHMLICKI